MTLLLDIVTEFDLDSDFREIPVKYLLSTEDALPDLVPSRVRFAFVFVLRPVIVTSCRLNFEHCATKSDVTLKEQLKVNRVFLVLVDLYHRQHSSCLRWNTPISVHCLGGQSITFWNKFFKEC